MRLRRLSIENWRGVGARSVTLADGVTLIAGPNEIGKSSLVEALRLLFNELDTSKKQAVRAIRPVDADVGSRVEAEVEIGEYRFVYAKTYNRKPATTLAILAPRKQQLAGREAHQEVVRILGEHVDMDLWEALLVDQGQKVGGVRLRESEGLARALDEAAGAARTDEDDGAVFRVVEQEYARYYTLKQGRPRYAEQQAHRARAAEALARAEAKCAEVEGDLAANRRAAAEVKRLTELCATQTGRVGDYETQERGVAALRQRLHERQAELQRARAALAAALEDRRLRDELIAKVEHDRGALGERAGADAPLDQALADLEARTVASREALREAEAAQRRARETLDRAHRDASHLRAVEAVGEDERRVARLHELKAELQSAADALAADRVTDEALAELRAAESALDRAQVRRDAAATALRITAERDVDVEIDGASVHLAAGDARDESVAARKAIRVPGIVGMTVEPSGSAAELQVEFDDAQRVLRELAARYGVGDLRAAVASNQRRGDATRLLERLSERRDALLADADENALTTRLAERRADCAAYRDRRGAEPPLPADIAAADAGVEAARAGQHEAERALNERRRALDALIGDKEALALRHRDARDAALRLEESSKASQRQLAEARERETDAVLVERCAIAASAVERVEDEAGGLEAQLDVQQGDRIEARLANAREVLARARRELERERRAEASSDSLLERARADGRFEALDTARREELAARRGLEVTQRRAAAARRLYETLSRHRDAAREAYVRPLEAAIEALGSLVYGPDFEVTVSDDWRIASRTLDGKTLALADLSVGTREQLDILTRLAAAQIVARHGGVPLIVDDALGFSDAARLEKMSEAIAAAGRTCQIIVLTSMPERFAQVGNAKVVRFDAEESLAD